ncbi:phenazine biosynthesis protein PhzF, partial [Enterococcus faecalis]
AATATSKGALACYLYHHQILQKTNYTVAQGYTLNAPSEVLVRLNTTPQKTIDQVLVGGRGYYVETKE